MLLSHAGLRKAIKYLTIMGKKTSPRKLFTNLKFHSFHHALHPLRKRQHNILERYQFICECQACHEDFPLFEKLSEFDETFDDFIGSDLDELENFTELEARAAITKYSEYIDRHSERYPCYEISILQECLLRCFRIFEKGHSGFNENFVVN